MHAINRLAACLGIALALPPLGAPGSDAPQTTGPIRVLFLGHDSDHHPSGLYYPMLAKALGQDAIYFDYVTSVEEALGDAEYLGRFDALLLYANHERIQPHQWSHLKAYVEKGGAFIPVHCASYCFLNERGFDQLVGARFKSHQTATFTPKTILPEHPAIQGSGALNAWDETYVHERHNPKDRVVLQVREPLPGDPHTEPEPWTWVRTEGKGRIFYTASGHDQRVWEHPEFHALIKRGILWAIGDRRRADYDAFLANRAPLVYEKRENIPNYERRPEPLPYQKPLPPAQSMKYIQAPVGFRLELFAFEPDIVNPICMAWDERGRLWVAETVDYPNDLTSDRRGHDSIKILEDSNDDGRCDRVKVFADGLNIPTSLTFSHGGVIVAHAPDFLYLKDTDGDDRADVREVLFTGWGVGDTHAGPSNLRYSVDNWIWGSVGYARFMGELGGKRHDFGSGLFRFKPDASAIEFLHQFNNNTWGLGFNSAGDAFGSTANDNPSFFGGIPEPVYGDKKRASARMIASSSVFHPITPNIRQVDAFGRYTAGAGHAFATSDAFPESYRDQVAFVCEPTGRLLGKFRVQPAGAGYTAKNDFAFLASADEWFAPVAAEVGPDGNLWVADWYNFIIQHNPTPTPQRGGYRGQTGRGNAYVDPNRDREHGRIYRVIWEKAAPSKIQSLAGASPARCVEALSSDNLFWRITAQRLLVERQVKETAPALRDLLAAGGVPSIHALWTLHGLGELDQETHQKALLQGDSTLKRNAIKALGEGPEAARTLYDSVVLTDRDPHVRRAAFVKLASLPDRQNHVRTASLLFKQRENKEDPWLALALQAAGASDWATSGYVYGPNLLPNPSFETSADNRPEGWRASYHGGPRNQADLALETSPDSVRSGRSSLRISSDDGHDVSMATRVQLKPDTEYRLSGWVKTKGVTGAMGALLNVHELQRPGATAFVQGDRDWTGVQVRFRTDSRTNLTVNALFGGWGLSKGTAWYDDLAIEEAIPLFEEKQNEPIVGSAERGFKIFNEHQVAACVRCHAVAGQGGAVGPFLDGIALRKDQAYILESLINPTAQLAEGFEHIGATPMPPMNIVLEDQELADVVAYLLTLKTAPKPQDYPVKPAESFE